MIDKLEFVVDYNKKIKDEIGSNYYICNELRGIKKYDDNDYYNIGIVLVDDENVEDPEIIYLINYLSL